VAQIFSKIGLSRETWRMLKVKTQVVSLAALFRQANHVLRFPLTANSGIFKL